MAKQLPNSAVVVEGDIERRVITVYTPDFYKDNPVFGTSLTMLKNAVPVMDYLFEKANALPQLVDIDRCPDDLLEHLGSLLAYEWKPDVNPEVQRKEIAKLVAIYHIRGTALGVIRVVMNAGATRGEVFTPYEHLIRGSVSVLSGGDRFEDGDFWRWGTYEVVSNVDFGTIYDDIVDLHPAGTKWFARQIVELVDEDPADPAQELDNETFVYHVNDSSYCEPSGLRYDDEVLADRPVGYWKLDEPATLLPETEGTQAQFGTAAFGTSSFGGVFAGLPAADSSGNSLTARYNSESEQLTASNGNTTAFADETLSVTPVIPGSVKIFCAGKSLIDDGAGRLTGNGSALIDYDTGEITDIVFDSPPGAGSTIFPTLLSTVSTIGGTASAYWDGDTITGLLNGDKVTNWIDSTTAGTTPATQAVYASQPTLEAGAVNGRSAVKFSGTQKMGFSSVSLGTTHTAIFLVRFDSAATSQLLLSDATSSFWYDGSNSRFTYTTSSGSSNLSYNVTAGRWYILTLTRNGTSLFLYSDGFLTSTATLGANTAVSVDTLGSGVVGALATALVYNTNLSASAQLAVEKFLGNKYNIPNQYYFRIDSDSITGLSNGASVNAEWQELSTTSRTVAQATSNRQPTCVTNAANGHAAVQFDGTGTQDVLALNSAIPIATIHTITVVFSLTSIRTASTHYLMGDTFSVYYTENGGSSNISYDVGGGNKVSVVMPLVAGRVYTLTVVRNGTAVTMYLDGVQIGAPGTLGANTSVNFRYIGDNTATPTTNIYGRIFHLSISDQPLGLDDLTPLHAHLLTKYATLSAPVVVIYNDYVQRGIDGAIEPLDTPSARFGAQANINKACVILPNNDLLKPRKLAYTVECWLRVPTGEGGTFYGNRWVVSGSTYQFDARVDRVTGIPELYVGAPVTTNEYTVKGVAPITDNQWHHVVVNIEPDSKSMALYVDGSFIASSAYLNPVDLNATGNFLIGALSTTTPEQYFRGDIDEVAVYRPERGVVVSEVVAIRETLTKSLPSNPSVWLGEILSASDTIKKSQNPMVVSGTTVVSDRVITRVANVISVVVSDNFAATDFTVKSL